VVKPKGQGRAVVLVAGIYVVLILLMVVTAHPHPLSYNGYNAVGDFAIISLIFGTVIVGAAFMPTVKFYASGMEVLRMGRVIFRADYSDVRSAREKMKIMGRSRPRELFVELSLNNKRRPVSLRASWTVSITEPNLGLTTWLRQKVPRDAYFGLNEQARR
jgi:hypothetical protein